MVYFIVLFPLKPLLLFPFPFAGNQHVAFVSSHDAFHRLDVDRLLNLLREDDHWFFT